VIIGVDIGTSGIRAILQSEKTGEIFQKCTLKHETYFPKPGYAEQNPDEILNNLIKCINKLMENIKEDTVILSLSTVLHSVLALDKNGERLTNLIIWADRRAQSEKKYLASKYGGTFFYSRSGCPLHSMYLPAKILWIRKMFPNATKFLSIKSYIVSKLTGKMVEDLSIASASGLLNLNEKVWDPDILHVLGLTSDNLPQIVSPYSIYNINDIFKKKVLLVVGSGDGMLANLGSGAVNEKVGVLTLGTSGAARVTVKNIMLDNQQETWCYILDDEHYLLGAAINSGGIVLEWLKKLLKLEDLNLIIDKTRRISPGSDGLIFLPFINGERSPHWLDDFKGVLIGLTSAHDDLHIVKSAMEGIAFRMRTILESVERVLGSRLERILATGGFTNSQVFSQLLSNVIGRSLAITNVDEHVALGAIMLAMKALGNDWKDILEKISIRKIIKSQQEEVPLYEKEYQRHLEAYEYLKKFFLKGGIL
jgi:gluconokinase